MRSHQPTPPPQGASACEEMKQEPQTGPKTVANSSTFFTILRTTSASHLCIRSSEMGSRSQCWTQRKAELEVVNTVRHDPLNGLMETPPSLIPYFRFTPQSIPFLIRIRIFSNQRSHTNILTQTTML